MRRTSNPLPWHDVRNAFRFRIQSGFGKLSLFYGTDSCCIIAAQQVGGPEPREATFASSVIRLSCSLAPWPGQLNRSTSLVMDQTFESEIVLRACNPLIS